jgi:hypothetical protein
VPLRQNKEQFFLVFFGHLFFFWSVPKLLASQSWRYQHEALISQPRFQSKLTGEQIATVVEVRICSDGVPREVERLFSVSTTFVMMF